jgi:hypothetical protein
MNAEALRNIESLDDLFSGPLDTAAVAALELDRPLEHAMGNMRLQNP